MATLAVGTLVASLWSIRQESLVSEYQSRLDGQILPDGTMKRPVLTPVPDYAPARAMMTDALYIARAASMDKNPQHRRTLLLHARTSLSGVLKSRPHWGEAWIVKAYIESLTSPRMGYAEEEALIRSYMDAPFVHNAGLWRAKRGMTNWNRFPAFAQARIANETVWLISAAPQTRMELLEMARNTPAYIPVFLRLRERRR